MSDEIFKNRLAAAKWLEDNAYPVKRSKFYGDCDKGIVPVNSDKTLSCFDVAKYGAQQLKSNLKGASVDAATAAEADLKKKLAEADIATRKAERMAREEDRCWLPAETAWAAIAALVTQIRAAVRHSMYSSRREIIQCTEGNQDKADETFGFIDKLIDDAMNEVSGQKIKIEFEK